MSASSKKKLRKELNAAVMTEKQLQEQKEAKQLRLITGLFAAAIAVMIVVVIASRILGSGIIPRNTTALTVGESKISAAELNHYYTDSINGFLNSEYGKFASLFGLDTTKPLDEQFYDEAEKKTWADYFIDQATKSAQSMYAIYNAAKADGYTLSEDAKASIDISVNNMDAYAKLYGYSSADAYIGAVYGEGCNEKTFRQYAEVQMIASEYAADKSESLTYDQAAIRAEDDKDPSVYSAYTYNYYYLANSKFYQGGTEDDKGNKTYSDEEMEAGRAAAEAAANSLLTATNIAELDAAIGALQINAEATTAPKSTRHEGYQYSSVYAPLKDWVTGDRTTGDITVIPNETTSHDHADGEECTGENDKTTVSGYYVVLFEGVDKNLTELVNVRHILVSFEGGKTDEKTGAVTYTDAEKLNAKTKAEEILAAFNAGEKTEEAFGKLATEKTTDTGSKETGGLYEGVYPGQMVANFNDWCFDAARKTGDTGIVETEYGYHVMYYVGTTGTTYRDFMIENTLRSADMSAWETSLIEANALAVKNTKYVATDLTFGSSK